MKMVQTGRQTDRHDRRPTDSRQGDRQDRRQTDRQTGRQASKQRQDTETVYDRKKIPRPPPPG